MSEVKKSAIRISASRLKTLQTCTMTFWYEEIKKLPSNTHFKTLAGSTVHEVFEVFFHPKRINLLRKTLLSTKFAEFASPPIRRLIQIKLNNYGISDRVTVLDIIELLEVAFQGIRPHFVDSRRNWSPPDKWFSEKRFQITLPSGAVISGFIDLLLVWSDRIIVCDLKSQGAKFPQASLPHNVQAIMYQTAIFKEYGIIPAVEFVMLRHAPTTRTPFKHIQRVEAPSPRVLAGLEYYVDSIYKDVNQFGLEDALSRPNPDQGFCERVCPYLRPFTYWVVTSCEDPSGDSPISSHLTLDKAKASCNQPNTMILEKTHKGCMARWSGALS